MIKKCGDNLEDKSFRRTLYHLSIPIDILPWKLGRKTLSKTNRFFKNLNMTDNR